MVYVNPSQAPVYRWYLQGGPLNGEIFTDWRVPGEGQRVTSDYVYRGKRTKRRNRGDYIFEYEPVPVSSPPAPVSSSTPGYQHPAADPSWPRRPNTLPVQPMPPVPVPPVKPAPAPPSQASGHPPAETLKQWIEDYYRWYSEQLRRGDSMQAYTACGWLAACDPDKAREVTQRVEECRVTWRCDIEHLNDPNSKDLRQSVSRCTDVLGWMAEHGFRPKPFHCPCHRKATF
jgi:hypothetical protein